MLYFLERNGNYTCTGGLDIPRPERQLALLAFFFWNSRGYGHLVTLAKGHMCCLSTFSKDFFSETTGQFHLNFICKFQAKGLYKFIYFVQVT